MRPTTDTTSSGSDVFGTGLLFGATATDSLTFVGLTLTLGECLVVSGGI